MINSFKSLVSAAIVAIAAFVYIYGKAMENKKKLAEYTKINILSYEYLIDDLKTFISKNKKVYSEKNLKVQILSKEMVKKMSMFLQREGVRIDVTEENCVGLILLLDNNPIYIKLYSYKFLAQDLLDILPKQGIYEQEIEI